MPARKNPPIGAPQLKPYHFKPGQSGNPEGGRAHNPIKRALAKLTVDTYREVIEMVLTGNIDNLRAMIRDKKTSAIQVGIATAFVKAIESGDYGVIERIAERIVGKIPDELNVNSKNLNVGVNSKPIDMNVLKEAIAKLESQV